jgi:hypothetical protein
MYRRQHHQGPGNKRTRHAVKVPARLWASLHFGDQRREKSKATHIGQFRCSHWMTRATNDSPENHSTLGTKKPIAMPQQLTHPASLLIVSWGSCWTNNASPSTAPLTTF